MDRESRNVVTMDEGQEHNIRRLLEMVRRQGQAGELVRDAQPRSRQEGEEEEAASTHGSQEDLAWAGFPGGASGSGEADVVDSWEDDPSLQDREEAPAVSAASTALGEEEGEEGEEVEEVHMLMGEDLKEADIDELLLQIEMPEPFAPVEAPPTERSQELLEELREKQGKSQYQNMLQFRRKLPSFASREEILQTVRKNQVTVISGETGCGKTTQVPQFILDDYIEQGKGCSCRIICTQPRRISAISVAERVGAERCETLESHGSVGYQIRLEHKLPRSYGSILFCTTGIVLKFLESDPTLQRATHLVLDEIHERDLQSDFLIIILKDLLPRRPDLKVILMSATLNAEMFSNYFFKCPMLHIPGYIFPVENIYLEDILTRLNYTPQQQRRSMPRWRRIRQTPEEQERQEMYEVWLRNKNGELSNRVLDTLRDWQFEVDHDLIARVVVYIMRQMEKTGAILIFVPGWDDISKLTKILQRELVNMPERPLLIPLHSLMPTVNQREVFNPPPPGTRKIAIATNIAETSITIDDVVYVVDCGKTKLKDFLPQSNLCTLEPRVISKANAKQRQGRAGRTQPGVCFKLFTRFHEQQMVDQMPPEMLRTPLEELCLQIKLLKLGRIEPFVAKAMQPPSLDTLHTAILLLQDLKALDHREELLPLGYHLARLPVDPHCGKMILFAAMFSCLDPVLTVATALSYKDAFIIPLGQEQRADEARRRLSKGSRSDHFMLINTFKEWEESNYSRRFCSENFLSPSILQQLQKMKGQLAGVLHDMGFLSSSNVKDPQSNRNSDRASVVSAVLCAGLYPNVAKVTKEARLNARFKSVSVCTKTDRKAAIHLKSVNSQESFFPSKWLVYYQKMKTCKVYLYDCGMVSPYPLLLFGGDLQTYYEGREHCISVDRWIVFHSSKEIAELIKELRQQLDQVLQESIDRPRAALRQADSNHGDVLSTITELLCMEGPAQRGVSPNRRGWRN